MLLVCQQEIQERFDRFRSELLHDMLRSFIVQNLGGNARLLVMMDRDFVKAVIRSHMPCGVEVTSSEIHDHIQTLCCGIGRTKGKKKRKGKGRTALSPCLVCTDPVGPSQVHSWCQACTTKNPIHVKCMSQTVHRWGRCPTCNVPVTILGFHPLPVRRQTRRRHAEAETTEEEEDSHRRRRPTFYLFLLRTLFGLGLLITMMCYSTTILVAIGSMICTLLGRYEASSSTLMFMWQENN